jgi:photosystem II stability/assembly factor-like uncharacterized protein
MIEETHNLDAVYALAVSPDFATDGICFAAASSGVFRSEDGGRTWGYALQCLNLQSALPTSAVAVSPTFAIDHSVFAGTSGGVLRSSDGGKTWQVSMLPPPAPMALALTVSPRFVEDGVLLVGTMEDGVFRSGDRGLRWSRWNFGLLDLHILTMVMSASFADDETLLVGTETGVFRSTNGGRAWREVDFPIDYAPVLSLALSPAYATDGVIFAGTESHGLFRSDDRGKTWRSLGEVLAAGPVNGLVIGREFPAKPHVLAVLDRALLVSRDGGQSWSPWEAATPTEEVGLSAVAAPLGLGQGAPLLLGRMEGGVVRI